MFQCTHYRGIPSFLKSHLMLLFGIPSRLEISIKGLQKVGFLCAISYYWFVNEVVWLGVARSRTAAIAV